jgi:hypothetical protein
LEAGDVLSAVSFVPTVELGQPELTNSRIVNLSNERFPKICVSVAVIGWTSLAGWLVSSAIG